MGSLAIFVLSLLAVAIAQQENDYVFDKFNISLSPARAEAVIGSSADFTMVYVLSGRDSTGKSINSNKYLDLTKITPVWTELNTTNFSRWGACYAQAQADARTSIWVYGGVVDKQYNESNSTFLSVNLGTNPLTFTALKDVPAAFKLPTTNVSCVAAADNNKFYVLFGETSAEESDILGDDLELCSSVIGVYDKTTTNWTLLNTTGAPSGRIGANALLYVDNVGKSYIVVFGGGCDTEEFNDVYRLDLTTNIWAKDTATGTIPARSYASAFIQMDTLFVSGGISKSGTVFGDAWTYNLVGDTKTWTMVNTTSSLPSPRYQASVIDLQNRGAIIGGQSHFDDVLGDVVQQVVEKACLPNGCEQCTNTIGCGYCSQNNKCIAGTMDIPFVFSSCNVSSNYITDLDSCPQIFPSYGIALLVIGGVVLVGIIIFAIMKVRGGVDSDKEGYERIR